MNKKSILNWWKLNRKDIITVTIVMLIEGCFLQYLVHLQEGDFKNYKVLIFIPYILSVFITAGIFLKIRIKNLEEPVTWYPWIPRVAYYIFIFFEYIIAIAIPFLGIKKPWIVVITLPIVWSSGRKILIAIVKRLNKVHIRKFKDNN